MKKKMFERLTRLVRRLVEGRIGHRVILLSIEPLPSWAMGKLNTKEGYEVRYIDTRTLFEKEIFFPFGGKEYELIRKINSFYSVHWTRERRIFVRTKRICGYAYNSQALPDGYCIKKAVRV